jgi:predicted AAA+ superfamily ATPase
LETVVMNELERRKAEVGYLKTREGHEVDFLVRYLAGGEELIQVCADLSAPETRDREVRALVGSTREHRGAKRRLLVQSRDSVPAARVPGVEVQPAYEWLLDPA